MEGDRLRVPETQLLSSKLAGIEFGRCLCGAMGPDVPDSPVFRSLVDDDCSGSPRGNAPRTNLHNFSRLRARLVRKVTQGEQYLGLHHWIAYIHSILPLAVGTFRSPRHLWRS